MLQKNRDILLEKRTKQSTVESGPQIQILSTAIVFYLLLTIHLWYDVFQINTQIYIKKSPKSEYKNNVMTGFETKKDQGSTPARNFETVSW